MTGLLVDGWATILQFQYRFKDNFGFASVVRVSIETTRRCWNLTTTCLSRWPLFSWNYFSETGVRLGSAPRKGIQIHYWQGTICIHLLCLLTQTVTSPTKMFTLKFFKNPCFYTNNKPEIAFQQRSNKSASIWRCDELKVWWWAIYCLSVGNLVLNEFVRCLPGSRRVGCNPFQRIYDLTVDVFFSCEDFSNWRCFLLLNIRYWPYMA